MPKTIAIALALFSLSSWASNEYELQCLVKSAEYISEFESKIKSKAMHADQVQGLNRYGIMNDPVTYIFPPKGHAAYPSIFELRISNKKGDRRWQHSGFTAGDVVACSKLLCEFDPMCEAATE